MSGPFGPARFVTCGDDVRLAWRELGAGPPLLLVHGWPLHGATWRQLAPLLAQRHRLVIVDLAGLGDSEAAAATDLRIEAHAERLRELTAQVIPGDYGCIATDTGATIARVLAARSPGLRRLLLLNTEMPGHRPPWIRWYQALFAVPGGGALFAALTTRPSVLRSAMGFGGCFVDRDRIGGEFHELFVAPVQRDRCRRRGMMRYLRAIDWRTVDALRALHATLPCRVHLVWGAEDPTFPVTLAREMCTQFAPPATFAEVAGARLLVHEEQPEAVAREALPFFA
jgi:haloalkane dehalogenase